MFLLNEIRGALPSSSSKHVRINCTVAMLNSRVTPLIFIGLGIALGTFQLFGKPLHCAGRDESFQGDFLDSYCWALSSESNEIYRETDLYPGLGPGLGSSKVVHAYYQWLTLVFLGLALLSRAPHLAWRAWEGGLLRTLLPSTAEDLQEVQVKWEDAGRDYSVRVGNYFKYNYHSIRHKRYCILLVVSEVLNVAAVLGVLLLIHLFLDGQFVTFGPEFLAYHAGLGTNRVNPAVRLFPVMVRCVMNRYGPSGTPERVDSLCVLSANVANQKIFVLIWAWLCLMLLITFIGLVLRAVSLLSVKERCRQVHRLTWRLSLLTSSTLVKKLSIGDWFVLVQLGHHFEPYFFTRVLTQVDAAISGKDYIELEDQLSHRRSKMENQFDL